MKKVAVVIPYYHSQLNELEQISFQQCVKVLYRYPIVLVVPDTMKESEYPVGNQFIVVKVPFQWMESIATYNRMMLDIDFYERFSEYEYILIYQLDAFVFRDELLKFCAMGYDYIGAPWPRGVIYVKDMQQCVWYVGNGGLSLRNVEASILMLKKHPADSWEVQEDIYWAVCDSDEFHVASMEIAVQFSIEALVRKMVERNNNQLPFGCHAWEKFDFSFWMPFFEAEGYNIAKEKTDDHDREIEKMPMNILMFPNKMIRKGLLELMHREINQIYVWGGGKIGKDWILCFRRAGFQVRCVDSNSLRWGEYLWDVCIESPEILKKTDKEALIIIAAKNDGKQIMEQLSQMKYCHGKAVYYYKEVQDIVLDIYNEEY